MHRVVALLDPHRLACHPSASYMSLHLQVSRDARSLSGSCSCKQADGRPRLRQVAKVPNIPGSKFGHRSDDIHHGQNMRLDPRGMAGPCCEVLALRGTGNGCCFCRVDSHGAYPALTCEVTLGHSIYRTLASRSNRISSGKMKYTSGWWPGFAVSYLENPRPRPCSLHPTHRRALCATALTETIKIMP